MLPVLHAELSDHFWSDQHDEVSAGNYNSIYYVIGFSKLAMLKSLSNILQHFHPQNFPSSKFKNSAVAIPFCSHTCTYVNSCIEELYNHPLA